jgi:hypothetical protein
MSQFQNIAVRIFARPIAFVYAGDFLGPRSGAITEQTKDAFVCSALTPGYHKHASRTFARACKNRAFRGFRRFAPLQSRLHGRAAVRRDQPLAPHGLFALCAINFFIVAVSAVALDESMFPLFNGNIKKRRFSI